MQTAQTQTTPPPGTPIGDMTVEAIVATVARLDADIMVLKIDNDRALLLSKAGELATGRVAWISRARDRDGNYWVGEGRPGPASASTFDDSLSDVEDLDLLLRWLTR